MVFIGFPCEQATLIVHELPPISVGAFVDKMFAILCKPGAAVLARI